MAGLVVFAKLFDKATPAGTNYSSLLNGKLFVSGSMAWSTTSLVANNISRAISLGEVLCNVDGRVLQQHLCFYDFQDYANTDLRRILETVVAFVRASKDPILVHCAAGVSRSPAIVIAILLKVYGYDLETAARTLIEARRCVQPNDGFLCQLYDLATELGQNPLATNTYPPPTAAVVQRFCALKGLDLHEIREIDDEPIQLYLDTEDEVHIVTAAFPSVQAFCVE